MRATTRWPPARQPIDSGTNRLASAKARSENQVMDEGQIGVRSAARRSGERGWGLLLLVWFAGNVVVATLAWFLVGLLLK